MSTNHALSVVAQNTGASEEDISNVLKGMIVSAKNQHGAQATNAEIAVVTGVCSKYGLNPLVKECAAFISGGKLSVVVMIDGWYKMVNRQPDFDGVEFKDHLNDKGEVTAITCNMFIKNRSRPVSVTEYLNECFDPKSSVWKRWPARMLRHKAYIQAARVAFGISEVIDDDEQNRITGNTTQQQKPVQTQAVDFDAMEKSMFECADIKTLNELCISIRSDLEKSNAWESSKAKCSAMKVKHKNRIEDMLNTEDADFEEVVEAVEAAEVEEVVEESEASKEFFDDTEEDVPFE